MQWMATFFLLGFAAFCSGCQTVPPPAVALEGSMVNGVYRSKEGRFTIALPQGVRQRTMYMQITEQYGDHSCVINFGPAIRDSSLLRLELVHKNTLQSRMVKLKNISRPILDGLVAQMSQQHQSRPALDESDTLTLAGREALHWRYFQNPAKPDAPRLLQHDVYLIDFPDDAAIIWVQMDPYKSAEGATLEAQQFASSLSFE